MLRLLVRGHDIKSIARELSTLQKRFLGLVRQLAQQMLGQA